MNIEIGQKVIKDGFEYEIVKINNEGSFSAKRGYLSLFVFKNEIGNTWFLINEKWFSDVGRNIFKCKQVGDFCSIKNCNEKYTINEIDEYNLKAELISTSAGRLYAIWVNVDALVF